MATSKHPEMEHHTGAVNQSARDNPLTGSALQALVRGWMAGTAGLPGDLEGLARMGINASFGAGGVHVNPDAGLPTSEFYKEWLPGKQVGDENINTVGSLFGGVGMGTIAKGVARAPGALTKVAQVAAANAAVPRALSTQAGVVKLPGGNWLTGSVEDSLSGLKNQPIMSGELVDEASGKPLFAAYQKNYHNGNEQLGLHEWMRKNHPDVYNSMVAPTDVVINNWVDKQLTRYVKNDMATERDPIRALAERGTLHYEPRMRTNSAPRRLYAGFPEEGFAKSDLAKAYEESTDRAVAQGKASGYLSDYSIDGSGVAEKRIADNAWLSKVPPETRVYSPDGSADLKGLAGFNHLIDELRNATNPQSGLPAHLLLDPASLDRVSVPQAVERVAAINAWREAQKAEANSAIANNAATHLHKEYADAATNPKGLKWVELKQPEGKVPEGAMWEEYGGNQRLFGPNGESISIGATKEEAIKLIDREGRKKNLADALKYEGDTMRHCVGRYCDDVASGKSRIFSLRDAKGQPHVTIETRPGDFGGTDEAGFIQRAQDRGWDQDRIQRHIAQLNESNAFDPTIIQIKGKSDKKPNDEYLPFVQDFVKSGKWSDVGDLQNSGLRKTSDAWNANELKKIQDAGITVPSHATQAEIDAIGEQVWPGQWGASTKGFAAGGSVQHFDGGGAVEAQRDAAQTAANARRQQDQAAYTTAHAMSRDDFLKKYGPTFVADDKGGNPWTLDAKDFLSQVSPLMARSAFTDYEKQMGGRYSGGEGGDFTPYSDAAGNYWSQADETPQDVTLTLADGRKWTPSGAENGIVFHPKGEVTQGNLIGNGGDGDDGSREKLVNPEDYYEVSGDASRLLGKDQSGQKVTVRYKQVGDKMVPMEDATYNGYKQGLWENGLQQVAMMAAMAYGGWALAPEMAAAGGAAGGAAGSATGGALAATGLAGSLGMQAGLGATALNTGALNTGMSLVRGKNIGDSLKSGATAAFLSPISSYVGDAVGGGYTGQILGNTALGGAQGVLNGQGFGKGLQDGFVNGLASSAGSYMGGLAKGATGSNFAGTAANSLTQSTLKGKDPKATLDSLATQYATGELTDLTGLPPQVANMVVNLAQNRKPTASQAVGALSQMGNAVGSTKMKQTAVGG